MDEAKQAASDSYLEYKFRQKNGVPVVSKRFLDVAKLCSTEMNKKLESGIGKRVYRDVVIVLEKYLIPFFGKMHVTSITYETLQKFALASADNILYCYDRKSVGTPISKPLAGTSDANSK